MELFPHHKTYNVMGQRYYAYVVSVLTVALGLFMWFEKGESKYGLDFTGGHELVVRVSGGSSGETVRKAISAGGFEDATVQSFEVGSDEYSIRLGSAEESSKVREQVKSALEKAFPAGVEILSTDYVGPVVGQELRRQALIAAIAAILGMVFYITVRFEFSFAVGAFAAMVHDVIVAVGIYLLCGHTLNMSALAAVLTIVGYSVNDTIIVFDRIREEIIKQQDKGKSLEEIMNYSISITLNRTLITSMLTWFSATSLFVFCGGAVGDLGLLFMIGIVTGTFSSIYVASPVALAWADYRDRHAQAE